jgi:molecular chaperone GrpE (heat shock protein)
VQITALRSEFEAAQEEVNKLTRQEEMQEATLSRVRAEMEHLRKSDVSNANRS